MGRIIRTSISCHHQLLFNVLCGRYLGIIKSISWNRIVIEHDHKSHFNKVYGEDYKNEYFLSSSIIV